MVGLESSGASSGPSSPRDHHHHHHHEHHMDETHPPSSLSASPPSTSSECGSATSSRRPSLPEHMQDENYREKRKRNNDAAKRSREKRRRNDQAIEQRLLELTKENSILKSQMNLILETKPENQRGGVEPSSSTSSSVIVAGPSAPQLFPPPSCLTSTDPINPELLYPLDLSQAAMAAAAAAAFKLPSCNGAGAIFSPQLLAAVAAANPLLQSTMPPINSFNIYSHPPPPQPNSSLRTTFQSPSSTTIPATPFMSARSAFHPVQRPSVVELGPSQPRATVTGQIIENSQQTSVIHHPSTPILREFSRPSVVQPPSIDYSKPPPITSSLSHHGHGHHHHNHHVHFVNDIPLAQEPRSSIFCSTGKISNNTSNNNNSILRHGIDEMALLTSQTPTATISATAQPQPSASSSSSEIVFSLNPSQSQNNNSQPSILGSLLSANRRLSPTVPQSRTEKQSGLSNDKPSSEDLKTSLSNLAVHLNSNSLCQSSSSTNSGLKSDTDSLASPQSTRSGSVEHSQNSPIEGECASGGDSGEKRRNKRSTPDLERYRDRRRRNNEAAKRCRANRRAAFEYRSKRSQQLENENGELRQEMLKLNNELEQLKAIIAANNRLLPTQ